MFFSGKDWSLVIPSSTLPWFSSMFFSNIYYTWNILFDFLNVYASISTTSITYILVVMLSGSSDHAFWYEHDMMYMHAFMMYKITWFDDESVFMVLFSVFFSHFHFVLSLAFMIFFLSSLLLFFSSSFSLLSSLVLLLLLIDSNLKSSVIKSIFKRSFQKN